MKRKLTVNEARNLFGSEKVYATNSGFLFIDSGKYRSGLTFVIDSSFELDQNGNVINPLRLVKDREVTDSLNLSLNGQPDILFGDFWTSQKGAPCFRPKDPAQAKHLLVRVNWGGCFNKSRGNWSETAKECGATYFRRASSNGGGSGYDYWVLPVGYVRQWEDADPFRIDKKAAQAYCAKHSKLRAEAFAEADRLYKEKLAAEAESRQNRGQFAPRLREIEEELAKLRVRYYNVVRITLGEECFETSNQGRLLYTAENLAKMEATLIEYTQWVAENDAKRAAKKAAYEEFAPKFAALQERALAVQLEVVIDDHEQAVLKKLNQFGSGSRLLEREYSHSAVTVFDEKIREKEQEQAERLARETVEAKKTQAEAEAKAAGLPSDIQIWKRIGSRTGCSKGWVIGVNGVERERDRIYNENSRRADRYDEGFEIWNQILVGELVIQWTKECTAAEHICTVVYRPETLTEAQLERVAEIQAEIEAEWEGLTGLASGKESPSIGDGWLGQLVA